MSCNEQIGELITSYHNCADSGASDAADTIRYEMQKLVESNISDSQASQNEKGNEDSKTFD